MTLTSHYGPVSGTVIANGRRQSGGPRQFETGPQGPGAGTPMIMMDVPAESPLGFSRDTGTARFPGMRTLRSSATRRVLNVVLDRSTQTPEALAQRRIRGPESLP
jgi:hypothetical protein